MAYPVKASPTAERDIASAFNYLVTRSPQAAIRWYRFVRTAITSLREMPTRCPIAPETVNMGIELRQFLFGRYRIVFKILEEEKAVYILTVRHSARRTLTDAEIRQILESF